MEKCKNCEQIKQEIEELRSVICNLSDGYSRIAERLWHIKYKKRS